MKKIKNNTGSTKIWRGQEVAAGAYYTIQEHEYDLLIFDADLQADITSGDAIFNDGTQDYTDAAEGLDLLKAISASCIRDIPVDDTDIADGRILKYNTTTKKLEYVNEAGSGSGVTAIEVSIEADTTSSSYTVIGQFIFRGTAVLSTLSKIKAIVHATSTAVMDVKVYDLTNALTIAELLGVTETVPTIKDLGTLSNVPSGESIFEIQVRKSSGGGSVDFHALSLEF